MAGQSRKHSAVETVVGTAVGFLVSWALTPPIMVLFGYHVGPAKAFGITAIYTVLSLARGYVVRRGFNWWAVRHAR